MILEFLKAMGEHRDSPLRFLYIEFFLLFPNIPILFILVGEDLGVCPHYYDVITSCNFSPLRRGNLRWLEYLNILNGYPKKRKKICKDEILTSSGQSHRTPQNDRLSK